MNAIEVDYVFSDEEKRRLITAFSAVTESPYSDYSSFHEHVRKIVDDSSVVSDEFREIMFRKLNASRYDDPYVLLKNCPVDPELPELDFDSPVVDKRNRKKTFIAEAFLDFYAIIMRQEPIGYLNVNDGDIFQDIHPMRQLMDTQSQKANKTIFFHKDLANHFVRPDWVNILGLRASPENEIYTSFVRNKDLIENLSDETLDVLRKTEFYTPYDDLTVSSANKELGRAPDHPILGSAEEYDIRFFENRTQGVTDRAKEAVAELVRILHTLKQPLLILKGDFIGSANNECIHNKEVVRIGDERAVNNRWLMKTVNVACLDVHKSHMCEGEIRIVNG